MMALKDFRELRRMVDMIVREARGSGMTWTYLADKSGLSYKTVNRLGNYTTVYPRAQTVMMLARAAGLRVVCVRVEKARRGASQPRLKVVG